MPFHTRSGLRPIGFALLVEDEQGRRMVVYSDDVDDASLTINTMLRQSESVDRIIVTDCDQNYELSLRGTRFHIQTNIEPLTDILEGEQKLIEEKKQ